VTVAEALAGGTENSKPRRPNVDADNYVYYRIDGKPSSKVCIRWPIFESEGGEIPVAVTLEW
jgi:hypothetical protein